MAAAAGSNGETLCPMSAPRGRFFMVNGVNQPERWVARAETQMSFWSKLTQNQVVDFILVEPELRLAVSDWARSLNIDEATTKAMPRLPYDDTYRRISTFLQSAMEPSAFS